MRRLLFLSALCIVLSVSTQAQNVGLGLKFGYPTSGITLKIYMSQKNAFDITVGGNRGYYHSDNFGLFASGTYQWRYHFLSYPGWELYYGPGAYLGSRNWKEDSYHDSQSEFYVGGLFVFGTEYRFKPVPISVFGELNGGVDIVPRFFNTTLGFSLGGRFHF